MGKSNDYVIVSAACLYVSTTFAMCAQTILFFFCLPFVIVSEIFFCLSRTRQRRHLTHTHTHTEKHIPIESHKLNGKNVTIIAENFVY